MQSKAPPSVVLVTGGSRGIGAAIVRDLHASGACVYFTYASARDEAAALARELGPERVAYEGCDIATGDALPALIERVLVRFGRLDALVNNAGVCADNEFDNPDYAAWRAGWQRTFDVNLFAAANLAYLALRVMRAQAPDSRGVRGRIVNVASRAAHRGELAFADYGASKAAMVNLTKSLARACAADGIVAFSVAPGFIETDMAAPSLSEHGATIRAEIPSGRVGSPAEVASIVAFLCSGGADYATGTTIDVNGASYVR